jgi:hypothetical protein
VHFYCIISDTNKCTFIYINNIFTTLLYSTCFGAYHDTITRGFIPSSSHNIRMSCCRFEQYITDTYQENGYTNVWLCGKISLGRNIERCIYITINCVVFKNLLKTQNPLGVSTLYHLHHNITLAKNLPCKCIACYKDDVHLSLKSNYRNLYNSTSVPLF